MVKKRRNVKEIRNTTDMSQAEFARLFNIPVSTLRKWEQGTASPPDYVIDLIIKALPSAAAVLQKIVTKNGDTFYYDSDKKLLLDERGNSIFVKESLEGVKTQNLPVYVADLFENFYEIQARFNRDCEFDKKEEIIWI